MPVGGGASSGDLGRCVARDTKRDQLLAGRALAEVVDDQSAALKGPGGPPGGGHAARREAKGRPP